MTIWFPRLTTLVPEIEESSDLGRWFLILKRCLISTVETLRCSKPLIVKGFNRTVREFSLPLLYKGLAWPYFFFFTHSFSFFAQNSELSSPSIFELPSFCFTLQVTFHQRSGRHPLLSYIGVSDSSPLAFSFHSTYSLFQVNSLTLHILVDLESFYFLIHRYLCIFVPLSLFEVAS